MTNTQNFCDYCGKRAVVLDKLTVDAHGATPHYAYDLCSDCTKRTVTDFDEHSRKVKDEHKDPVVA